MNDARSLSLYRGYSRAGIGEGEGRRVAHGEQYLAADGPLATDNRLLDAATAWMTLDATPDDWNALGPRLEAWSYFSVGDLRFVGHLTAAGRYDARHAYFTHARAWRTDAFANGRDPGALIGVSGAFEAPWSTRDPRTGFQPSEAQLATPPAPTPGETGSAVSLLAHIYQAVVSKYPVIMAAPLADFASGSALHSLVAFARAALPLSVKRDCSIRIYTRHPDIYLIDARANVVVLPEEEAAAALATRRDATLLDRRGVKIAGREATAPFVRYAEETVRRASDRPDALLRFSERVEQRPWSRTGTEETGEVGFIYAVAAATRSTGELDQFVRSLYKTLEVNAAALPRQQLLTVDDLKQCSDNVLQELVLKTRSTTNAMALRQMIEDAADDNGVLIESTFDAWWNSGFEAELPDRTRRAIELAGGRMQSAAARAALRRVPADALRAALDEQSLVPALMRVSDAGDFRHDWVPMALAIVDDERLVKLILWMLADRSRRTALRESLWQAFELMLTRNLPVPQELAARLASLVPESSADDLGSYLLLTELLHRSDSADATRLVSRLAGVTGRDSRRQLVAALDDSRWTALSGFQVPESWDRDTGDLLVGHYTRRSNSVDAPVRLVRGHRTFESETRARLFAAIDSRMQLEPEATTSTLIRRRAWLTWRFATTFAGDNLKNCARHWLTSPSWKSGIEPYLEDWKEVVRILRQSVQAEDFATLATQLPPIEPFEDEQRTDWLTTAADLVGLARAAIEAPALRHTAFAEMDRLVNSSQLDARALTQHLLDWTLGQYRQGNAPPYDLLQTLDQLIEQYPVKSAPSEHARLLASQVTGFGWNSLAKALYSTVSVELDLVTQIATALSEGKERAACWQSIDASPRRVSLLTDVAERIARTDDAQLAAALRQNGWLTFMQAVERKYRQLLDIGESAAKPLPALQLAAVLDSGPTLGALAAGVAMSPSAAAFSRDEYWWRSVLASLTLPRRGGFRSPSDRWESAIALLRLSVSGDARGAMQAAVATVEAKRERQMSIADVVTPFSPTENRSQNHVTVESGGAEIMLLGSGPLDLEALKKATPEAGWSQQDLAEFLRRSRMGGLTARLTGDGRIELKVVPSKGFKPARVCAVISAADVELRDIEPGGSRSLKPGEHVLRLGEHILLPTDADSEDRLQRFIDFLDYLPSDRRLLVLDQIRRPSLEWRVQELERKLEAAPAATRPSPRRGVVATVNKALGLRWNARRWAITAAAALALIFVAATLYLWPSESPALAIESIEPDSVVAGGEEFTLTVNGNGFEHGSTVRLNGTRLEGTFRSSRELVVRVPRSLIATAGSKDVEVRTPDGIYSEPVTLTVKEKGPAATQTSPTAGTISQIEAAKGELLEAVRQAPSNSSLRGVYATHIDVAPSPKDNPQAPDRRFTWALLKLQLLKDGRLTSNDASLGDPLAWTSTRRVLETDYRIETVTREQKPAKLIHGLDSKVQSMLALASCKGWREPGLPGVTKDPTFMLFEEDTCQDIEARESARADAVAAMNDLTEWVKTQK